MRDAKFFIVVYILVKKFNAQANVCVTLFLILNILTRTMVKY